MAETENKVNEFDKSGQYEAGLQSLVRCLRVVFFTLLVIIIGMLIYFFTLGGYVEVRPQEAVVVLRFGKYLDTHNSGWYWYAPYPVTKFVPVRTNSQKLEIAFMPANAGKVAEPDAEPQPLEPGRDNYLITGDANIIHTAWVVTYQITNPRKYYEKLLTPADPLAPDDVEPDNGGYPGKRGPQTTLTNFFRRAAVSVTGCTLVDNILYGKKNEYSMAVQREFVRLVADSDCGVNVLSVELTTVAAPDKTKRAFAEVTAAQTTQGTLISEAEQYRVKTASEAESQVVSLIAEAETYRKQVVAEVKSQSIYFTSIHDAYKTSPDTVLMALYNQTLADVLENQDGKYILGTDASGRAKQVRIKINPEPRRAPAPDQAEVK